MKENTLKGLTYIDLFAGIGGFRRALDSFGAKCVFSSEWDKHAQDTYEMNYNDRPFGDITQINDADIPTHDILCAGFPCQAFSVSGLQQGFNDSRGTLFFEIARIAKYHQPKILILENVRNFAKHDGGKTLSVVKNTLDELGYDVWYKTLNASRYGLPQNRDRIFIICIRKDLDVKDFKFPEPTDIQIYLKDIVLPDSETEKYIIDRKDMTLDISKIPKISLLNDYPLKPVRIGTINKGGQGERIYSEYGHSVTLSAYGGGAGSKTGCYYINNRVRKLAPRECARIQGFPETFKIPENDSHAWKQFGNSVPVTVVKAIVKSITEVENFYMINGK